jgi:dTDP-glucose 4,6-dehydratase
MGAESHVDNSITNPYPFLESNVIGTVNMLELANNLYIEGLLNKFIYVSTDEVYGPAIEGKLHKEYDPHKPSNPYSASKAAGEDFCFAYHNTYKTPIIITRTMNNFGERQDVEKFVPKTMKAIMNNEPINIHCKMKGREIIDISSRCWLHARNHADGLVYLLENGVVGEQYNIVGKRIDVLELAKKIADIMNDCLNFKYEDFHSFRPGHDMHYGLDGTKIKELG